MPENGTPNTHPGKVYLVGAGPGDPGLITVKGLECLRRAQVVVYDRLINPRLLREAPEGAALIYAGKRPRGHALPQEEINALLVEQARQGKVVVRLKGGDPFVFGRGGEEAEALAAAGVPFEVVPGVTSAIAVPAYAGIPVTHRNVASSFAVIAGHRKEDQGSGTSDKGLGKDVPDPLSLVPDTLIFLMGVANLPCIVEQLLAQGRSPETPVAVIRWGTEPQQETIVGTLADIAERVAAARLQPPAVTVVGEAVKLRESLRWNDGGEHRPLLGKRVLVTRARQQAAALGDLLRELGAQPIDFPTIRIAPSANFDSLDQAVRRLGQYDWVIFTSANGVRFFWERLELAGLDARALAGIRLGAIGTATAGALASHGLRTDYVPEKHIAEAIVEGLGDIAGQRVLLPRADIARQALAQGLRERGAVVDEVTAYRTELEDAADGLRVLGDSRLDIATFTSSSTVRNFVALLGDVAAAEVLSGALVACIGPVTAQTAEELGIQVDVVAEEHTIQGLVRAIVNVIREGASSMTTATPGTFPAYRLRRLRRTSVLRRMVRETRLSPDDFIYPLFVVHGYDVKREISSLPGNYHWSVDRLPAEVEEVFALGIPAVILFGLPAVKDAVGSENFAEDGIVQQAIRAIKQTVPELVVITDVCMCEYTDHGHCGVVRDGVIQNDETLEVLGRVAASHAVAGADVVAPSGMMDGQVRAIRQALDEASFPDVAILSYAAKYASSFYGPFRDAAQSPPKFGDRRSHQMDPANVREALREVQLDVEEGADIVMVKPALAYLDVIRAVREAFHHPVAAYNVSGEYAMVKAAGQRGWIDERGVTLEILTAIKRAGADLILTYHAKEVAQWLRAPVRQRRNE